MSETKNTISSLVAQFIRLQRNALEIINKLSNAATSSEQNVNLEYVKEDNNSEMLSIPSWGFLVNEIKRLDSNIQALSGLEDGTANIRKSDGTVSKILEAKILKDPDPIGSLQLPGTFKTRANWFFESFLNPLLYVTVDLTDKIPTNSSKVYVKRIIANTSTAEQKAFFDTNIKGRNDLTDLALIGLLNSSNINYFIDEEVVDLPLGIIRNKGSFSVLRVFDQAVQSSQNGTTFNTNVRKYKLDKLTYTDILAANGTDNRELKASDFLITKGGTKYQITSIDTSERTVVLKRSFGFESITIGVDSLYIYSEAVSPTEVHVNVGHDERQGVFIKAISTDFNIAGSTYSQGICFWSNELTINTDSGVKNLDDFYKEQVSDFGSQILGNAKEKVIPSVLGRTPDAPILNGTNFKVIQINQQITESKTADTFDEKIKTKVTLQNEIQALDKSIDLARKQLSTISTVTNLTGLNNNILDAEKIRAKIQSLTNEKSTKTTLLSSTIQDLNNLSQTSPELTEPPKYRIRGFWPIPAPVDDEKTGPQSVIAFKIRYRYLTKQGNTVGTQEIKFTDTDGQERRGSFSNWIEMTTATRQKEYDTPTGKYVWQDEVVEDSDTPNINQLDIPITKGEKVEIKISSISEAGWPLNPLQSNFSDSIVVDFPDDLTVQSDNSQYVKDNISDSALIKVQQDLSAKGLDNHLSTSYNSGDRYFAHSTSHISSGFYDTAGNSIDLFQKLTQIDQELSALKTLISKAKGVLSVYLRKSDSSEKIRNGSTIKSFAGYYNEIIDLSNTSNYGKIASIIYELELKNEAASVLELSSLIPGGQKEFANDSNDSTMSLDYRNNRKYDKTPVSLSSIIESDIPIGETGSDSFIHIAPFQSGNAKSQYLYPRYKSVGLDDDLYFSPISQSNVVWNSSTGATGDIPSKGGILIPYDPNNTTKGTANSNIWNGSYFSGAPQGNGNLNEFCVHIGHPSITDGNSKSFSELIKPTVTTQYEYPHFRHTLGFEMGSNDSANSAVSFQKNAVQQMEYTGITSSVYGPSGDDYAYPFKLGFDSNDEWLNGKYSCGSYFYISPSDHAAIQIEGTTSLAKKSIDFGEENTLVIPIIFQFRCMDKLGYIGGYRESGPIRNITYTKKIGIDIQVKGEDLFSFDLEVSGSYTRKSLVAPAYSQSILVDKLRN